MKKNIMNTLRNMKKDFVASYNESKTRYDAKFAGTVAKAEEASYNVVKAVYAPAYAAGYVSDMGAIKKASNIAHNIAEDVKFSAKEGYVAGKEAHASKVSEAKVVVTPTLAQSIDKWTESNAAKQAAQELAARWQKEFEEFCQKEDEAEVFVSEDEENAVYYGDGIWNGTTAF